MARPRISPVLFAALATLVARVAVALSRIDELELELYSGSLAWALLEGMPLHPDQLPVIEHNRGSVVVALLLLPFFAVSGPVLWPLKVIAIGTGVLVAALAAHLCTRAAGRSAGFAAGLLVALLPPAFQMVDVLALGSHADSILFLLAALSVLVAVGARGMRRLMPALALGFFCGLGYFYSLQFVVVLPALAAAAYCQEREAAARGEVHSTRALLTRGLPCIALPLLGFFLLAKLITTSTEIVNRSLDDRVLPDGLSGALAKFAHTWSDELWRSWLFLENGGAVCALLYGTSAVLALLLLLPRVKRLEPLAVFFLLHPLGVTAAYALTDFRMNFVSTLDGGGSRYMLPAMLSMAAWIALAHGGLVQRGQRALAWVVSAPALCAGALGLLSLLDPGYAWGQPPMRGTEFPHFRAHFAFAGGEDFEERLRWIEALDTEWAAMRPLCYEQALAPQMRWDDDVALLHSLDSLQQVEGELAAYQAVALGHFATQFWMRAEGSVAGRLRSACSAIPASLRDWFLRGVGRRWFMSLAEEQKILRDSEAGMLPPGYRRKPPLFTRTAFLTLPPDLAQPVAEGMGFQLGWRTTPYEHLSLELLPLLQELPVQLSRRIFLSAGKGYRMRFVEASYELTEPFALRIEDHMNANARESFRRGLAADPTRF